MQMVIEIPEEEYELVRHGNKSYTTELELMNAVANGIPLPEHHGDLVDRDTIEVLRIGNIKREYDKGFDAGVTCMVNRILDAPTILEADKEGDANEKG